MFSKNGMKDNIYGIKSVLQNVILDMFSTLAYYFIHIFTYICEVKTLVNLLQAPKHLIHMSE